MTPLSDILAASPAPYTAFYGDEAQVYYDLLRRVPQGGTIVEIGLQFGRSSAVALTVARDRRLEYIGVDPFIETPDSRAAWIAQANSIGHHYILRQCSSGQLAGEFEDLDIDLTLIDGDHTANGVMTDCALICPLTNPGGYVLFHDYGNPSLPDVQAAAECFMTAEVLRKRQWSFIGITHYLGVWRRDS